jgi:hypothetical protein
MGCSCAWLVGCNQIFGLVPPRLGADAAAAADGGEQADAGSDRFAVTGADAAAPADGGDGADAPRLPAVDASASCSMCPAVTNGAYACPDGVACVLTCDPGFLSCAGTPRSCLPARWSFETGLEGFQLAEGGLNPGNAADGLGVSEARAVDGARSLVVPATFNCTRVSVQLLIYPCGLGTPTDLRGKTLQFQVYLDGPALLDGPKQASVTILAANAQSADIPVVAGQWTPVSLPITDPSSAVADGFSFTLYMVPTGPPPGMICLQWSGSIFLDDFRVR